MNAEYEGKGYMTEAVLAIVRWASTEKAGFVPNGKMGEEGPRFVWKG